MSLPFALPLGRIPVIVPRPEVRKVEFVDGRLEYEAYPVRYLPSHSERGLFDIGLMLDILQFGNITKSERYVIQALERRLTFSGKLDFPGLAETGVLISVKGNNDDLVWATISQGISVTRSFTILDLCHDGMALNNLEYLKEVIESNQKGCPEASADALLKRFQEFKPKRREEIYGVLENLLLLGILRELVKLDNHRYRAVFNPHLVVSTRSGIRRGTLEAEDVLRIDGTEITYTLNLGAAREPANRTGANVTGRRPYITRDALQAMYDAERVMRIAADNKIAKAQSCISEYEENGYLSLDQDKILRRAFDDPIVPKHLQNSLKQAFASAHSDPLTEIPTTIVAKKDNSRA
jgi:hypothetical protein